MAHSLDAPPLEALPAATPEGLRAVLAKLLEKDPAQRYQTPAEVAQALAPFVKKATGVKPSPALASPPPGKEKDRPARERNERTITDEPVPPARGRGWLVPAGIGAGLFVVLLLAVSVLYLSSRGRAPGGASPSNEASEPPSPLIQASEQDLGSLLAKMNDPDASRELLREEVLDFCRKYRGQPACERAAALLPKLPRLENSIGMKLVPFRRAPF
jgi:hypothetical protein